MDKETLLQLGADEAAERAIRHSSIQVLNYTPSRDGGPLLCRAGSVTVFVARKNAQILDRVRKAADRRGSKGEDDVALANYFIKSFQGRQQLTRYRAWTTLHNSEVFADLRYGAKTLATHIVLPSDVEVAILENPYNGGRIDPPMLTLVEHTKDDTDSALEAVALRHVPALTEAEKAALERVPADQLELSIDLRSNCCDSITEYVERVVFITFTVTCMCAAVLPDLHIRETELRSLGSARSARKLMALRRELLGHDHP
jgi:hypothetical protein